MSLQLDFEPHSWYYGAAIQKLEVPYTHKGTTTMGHTWRAYYLNGDTGYIVDFESDSLLDIMKQVKVYVTRERARIASRYPKLQGTTEATI